MVQECLRTILAAWLISSCGAKPEPKRSDVLVYGGTASGVIAAIAAAREGAEVLLLEPGRHVGGMVSGGLGQTDRGNDYVIGGLSRQFFTRVGHRYGEPTAWFFEPHVAESVLVAWLRAEKVPVLFEHRIESVVKKDGRITGITTQDSRTFTSKVYLDCSYEGDLLARAGVSYTWGREGKDEYGEPLAGRRPFGEIHQFQAPVSGCDDDGKLLRFVNDGDPGIVGEGDRKVQAYTFRLCLTNRKEGLLPFPRPPGYRPTHYELLRRYLTKAGPLRLRDVIYFGRLPNGKTDVNNNGPLSTDHIGASWDYPEADYERRREIWEDHKRYVQGFFYFLANDSSVPKALQAEVNEWGLAKDEFVDTDHWPHQLYVREARRMIGQYVMTQADLEDHRTKPDSIGMGSYSSDSHHVQRVRTADGTVLNEGMMQTYVRPYEIPYRSIAPKPSECTNVLVPVCVSASHVAFSSIRTEPVYMILGHSAGLAAARVAKLGIPVQDVDLPDLQKRLRAQRQILGTEDAKAPYVAAKTLRGIVVDNEDATVVGAWRSTGQGGPFVGLDYLLDRKRGRPDKCVRYVPELPSDGLYEVRVSYTPHRWWAANVVVRIHTATGTVTRTLNQKVKPADPPFASLGTFRFRAGSSGSVEIRTAGTKGIVVADAVQWLGQSP